MNRSIDQLIDCSMSSGKYFMHIKDKGDSDDTWIRHLPDQWHKRK